MATITLLHWNIEKFTYDKATNANGQALVNYIATVAVQSKANIISLVEVYKKGATAILARVRTAIDLANGVKPPAETQWKVVWAPAKKGREAYAILYKKDNKFEVLKPEGAALGADPISGATNQGLEDGKPITDPQKGLPFNGAKGQRSGGRPPYYLAFETTDSKKKFTILQCHIMFGRYKPIGVRSAGLIAQCRAIIDTGKTVKLDASMFSGDFNVDFNEEQEAYSKLLDIPSMQATNAKTSLKKAPPKTADPTSADYLANAYDNIFQYNGLATPVSPRGTVFDLISATTSVGGSGVLSAQAEAFVRWDVEQGKFIKIIPPKSLTDSWRLVLHAISDHLPVYVTMVI